VEIQLGEVMSNLESEHEESCKLVTELDQEQRIAGMVSEKIREHEGYVARTSENISSVDDVKAQRTMEIEHLKTQIVDAEAARTFIEEECGNVHTAADTIQKKLAKAQTERRELEGKLVEVRNTLTEADSEHKLVENKGQRLFQKLDLVRNVSEKRQQASNGLQRSLELENERKEALLKEAKDEKRRSRGSAVARQQDLRMQIDAIKDTNVQLQNSMLAISTEQETSQQNLKFEYNENQDKLDLKRQETDTTKDNFEKTAHQIREAQQQILDTNETRVVCEEDEEQDPVDISRVHSNVAAMDKEFHHMFQVQKTGEDFLIGLKRNHDEEYEIRELQGDTGRTQHEIHRCRGAAEKLLLIRRTFVQRKTQVSFMSLFLCVYVSFPGLFSCT